ncbi:hypothetical protein XELAEV_18010678mg [Xenopus laevis]|uniref:Uncharacterized protein n=1 Tax=Xenopus laevis TaxID=8355 RepID=A0A974I264_XENLA|nr:hypothetical protein XELAEV_18010678mg [Xenopus laevis]
MLGLEQLRSSPGAVSVVVYKHSFVSGRNCLFKEKQSVCIVDLTTECPWFSLNLCEVLHSSASPFYCLI